MSRRRLENADEIGVNDIDDETPTASDNDYDSDTTIDYNYEPAAQFAVNETSYPPHRQRLRRHVVTMWITSNLEYWCRSEVSVFARTRQWSSQKSCLGTF